MKHFLRQWVKFVFEALMFIFWKLGAVFIRSPHKGRVDEWLCEGKSVLVIQMNYLGDTLLTLPALYALKKTFPDVKVTFMIRHEFYDIVKLQTCADDIVCTKLGTNQMFGKNFFLDAGLLLNLRKRKFDAIVDMSGRFATAWMSWGAGAPVRIGCKNPCMAVGMKMYDFGWLFTHHREYLPGIHLVDFHKSVFESTGICLAQNGFMLNFPDNIVQKCRQFLLERGVTFEKPVVVLHAGANHKSRRWTKEGFVALADALITELGCRVVFTGSLDDVSRVEAIRSSMREPAVSIAGETTLVELASIVSLCNLFISTFTGPMHLALLAHVPTIGLSCVDDPRTYFPQREACVVIHKYSCCGKRYYFFNAIQSSICGDETCECMSTIPWEEVFEEAKNILKKTCEIK